MLFRSLRWAYIVPIVVAQLFAFFTMFEIDQDRVIGPTFVIKVSATTNSGSSSDVASMLRRTSRTTGAGIAREVTDPTNPNGHRTLLVAADDRRSLPGRWIETGYDDFDPLKRTTVVALQEHDSSDPRGYYYSFGSRTGAESFAAGFRALGYDANVGKHDSLLGMSLWTVGGSGLPGALAAALLVVVLAVGGALGAPRLAALRRASGESGARSLAREAASAGLA